MVRGFIKPNSSVIEVISLIEKLKQNGVSLENISINQTFTEFCSEVTNGDTLIIESFTDVFSSLTELFTTLIDFNERKISLTSLNEPDLVIKEEQTALIETLHKIGGKLRAARTKRGLTNAKAQGKKLGRPFGSTKVDSKVSAATKLTKTSNMSIEKACEIAGCTVKSYYRHVGKKKEL